jgi:hypothetical protein
MPPAIIARTTAKRGRPDAWANRRKRRVRLEVGDAVDTAILTSSYVGGGFAAGVLSQKESINCACIITLMLIRNKHHQDKM